MESDHGQSVQVRTPQAPRRPEALPQAAARRPALLREAPRGLRGTAPPAAAPVARELRLRPQCQPPRSLWKEAPMTRSMFLPLLLCACACSVDRDFKPDNIALLAAPGAEEREVYAGQVPEGGGLLAEGGEVDDAPASAAGAERLIAHAGGDAAA